VSNVPIAKLICFLVRVQISQENVGTVNCSASALCVSVNQFGLRKERFGIGTQRYLAVFAVILEFAVNVLPKKETVAQFV
jgi:hypothetical protein